MIPSGVYDATIVALPGGTTGWAVNLRGTVIAAAFVGAYTPTQGDTVRVLVSDGVATVLGQVHAVTPASYGTVVSTSGQTAQVSTESGTVTAWFGGSAPANGAIVRLDWQTSIPWILSSLVSAPGAGGSTAPPAPTQPTIQTRIVVAARSGNWVSGDPSPPSGGERYEDGWPEQGPATAPLGSGILVYTGVWRYSASTLKSFNGKTLTSVRFFLPNRWRGEGYMTSSIIVHLATANPSFPISGVAAETTFSIPYSWKGGWLKLPIAFGNALKDDGFVILKATGTGYIGSDSAAFAPISADPRSGQLEIKWSV